MVERELKFLISQVQSRQSEEQTVEVKSAHNGCPERLYDTISAFANQDSGGILLFGLDESRGFAKVGVYDAQDLQKKVVEYCEQMTPVVRPVFTVTEEEGLLFVSAEIPPLDISERPCFKTARGRLQGSYVRVGDADKRMSEYEIYSYEAFRKKYREDLRPVEGITLAALDATRLEEYLLRRKMNRPNLASLPLEQLYELTNITRNGEITLSAVLLFGIYPQAYFPQLSIIAANVPSTEMGALDQEGRRFTDSRRIEGTLPELLDGALAFVRNNMRMATRLDQKTGARVDTPQYPMDAVREAVLNALIHRDYSMQTEGMPIQLTMYTDRLEIRNPGGLYGRMSIDELGHAQPDTRNPALVTAMESLGQTENRYSGIPRIRYAMRELSLPEPVFKDNRAEFQVCLYNNTACHDSSDLDAANNIRGGGTVRRHLTETQVSDEKGLLAFCETPRSRKEIIDFLAIPSAQYALRHYLDPLIEAKAIRLSLPDKPRSPRQQYQSVGCTVV